VNAVNRLIYEVSRKSKPRTTEFYVMREGTINMAMTTAAERDQRDEIKLRLLLKKAERHSKRKLLIITYSVAITFMQHDAKYMEKS